jgi:hypothetical protein
MASTARSENAGDDHHDGYVADPYAGAAIPAARGSVPLPAGINREAPSVAKGWGRGPIPTDKRKYRYDVLRAHALGPVSFSVSKEDRMDADEAGEVLHQLHKELGIDRAQENKIHAFNHALFFQHTINGASMLQKGEGRIVVGGESFSYEVILRKLDTKARRFFRAFADDIAEVNRGIMQNVSSYDPEAMDKYGQLQQVAAERGLHKYPHLSHDSADACLNLSLEERRAVIASKRHVLMIGKNSVDMPFDVQEDAAIGRAAAG